MKDDHVVSLERLEKEIAVLRGKEVLTKESTVEDYKDSDNFQDVVE